MPAASARSRAVSRWPFVEQHFALAKIQAFGANVAAFAGGFLDLDAVAVARGHFLDDDGIGAVGHERRR